MTEPERIQSSLETAAFIAAASGDNAWEGSDSTHLPTYLPDLSSLHDIAYSIALTAFTYATLHWYVPNY